MTNETFMLKIREIVKRLEDSGMRCNCDFDNWSPEPPTGHSYVCRIREAALAEFRK